MAVPPWPTEPPRPDPASSEPWGHDPWSDEEIPTNHPWTAEPLAGVELSRRAGRVAAAGLGCGAVAALLVLIL
jgi:hypothetical protein